MNRSNKTPEITVLMTVFNGEMFIREAIDSIRGQTFSNWELLIVDDASTDGTVEIIESIPDDRIRLIRNKINLGQDYSLNIGLENASGQFIARLDADDISLPTRLEKSLNVFSQNPKLGLLGTGAEEIDQHGNRLHRAIIPTNDGPLLRWLLLFRNPFVHSSVVYRKSVVKKLGGYHLDSKVAEDYELWSRISWEYEIANIQEPLILLRRHERQLTKTRSDIQVETAHKISRRNLKNLLPDISEKNLDILLRTLSSPRSATPSLLDKIMCTGLIWNIYFAFKEKYSYEDTHLLYVKSYVSKIFGMGIKAFFKSFFEPSYPLSKTLSALSLKPCFSTHGNFIFYYWIKDFLKRSNNHEWQF